MSIRTKIHELAAAKHRPHVWFHSGEDEAWRCWFCGATYEASPWFRDQICAWEYRPRHSVGQRVPATAGEVKMTAEFVPTPGWSNRCQVDPNAAFKPVTTRPSVAGRVSQAMASRPC
jgi:hypothetical protein